METLIALTLASVVVAAPAGPVPQSGLISQYAPGVMDRVIENRLAWGQLNPHDVEIADGFVARPECRDIGSWVYIRPKGGDRWLRMLVTDCGCPIGRAWMYDNNVLVEVDYETASTFGFAGKMWRGWMLTEDEYTQLFGGEEWTLASQQEVSMTPSSQTLETSLR